MIITDENYTTVLKRLDTLKSKLRSVSQSYSPNSGFALTRIRDGKEIVYYVGSKKALTEIAEINAALAALDGETEEFNLVPIDSQVRFYHHHEMYNNFTYMERV